MSGQATIGAAILRCAELYPASPAVVATGFESLSYCELRDYLTRVQKRLRLAGFDSSARIAVALLDGADAALAIVAVACAAVAIPIDMQLTAPEVERRLALLRPRAVVLLRDVSSAAREAALRRGLDIIEASRESSGRLGLILHAPQIGLSAESEGIDATSTAFILQTSGTTADPKLIPYSHGSMLAAAARIRSWFDLGPADRCLRVIPLGHSHGLKTTVVTPLITGGSIAFPANPLMLDIEEWLVRLRPTWYSAGPTLHRFMLDKSRSWPRAALPHLLRFIASGGAPLARDIREGLMEALGVPVLEHYGSSEAASICSNLPPPGPSKPNTCGIPTRGTVKIVTQNGHEAAAGERGEILVAGPTVITGYLDAPELNRTAFVDGWFRTGDIGSLDEDGFLTLYGRETELINRGGEKISPAEIDNALLCHPEVAEAAAFGVPHPRLLEDVAAVVVLKPGANVTRSTCANSFCRCWRLPRFPAGLLLLIACPKELPASFSGNVSWNT